MPDFYGYFIFILGCIFGSFANVLIVRMPAEESILTPSHCRRCKKKVRWFDNVPLLSYLILRGRCRFCREAFSLKYPLVELTMGALFFASYMAIGWSWFLLEFLIFVFGSVTASFIDWDHYILPDEFTLGGLVIALIGAVLNPERQFMDALLGLLFGGGFLYLTAYLYLKIRGREGMGGGDIKLLAWIGALLGWTSILFVLIVSNLVALVVGLVRMAVFKKSLQDPLPFGPFLVGAAIIFVLLDPPTMVQWLKSFYGLQ